MDQRIQVDAVYTDFQKAFDKVDHELLLAKIAYNGIRGDLLRWFTSYVTKRTQKVVVRGFHSATVNVTSGVPQGSILGPLLFILFINDIGDCFKYSKFLLYADDLKIFKSIKNHTDCQQLQEDLDRFSDYSIKNKLHLNITKCSTISFTKNKHKIFYNYNLNKISLIKVPSIRDLGVLLDDKLHLDQHIHNIIKSAFRMYGFVMRATTDFKRASSFIHLYKSLVRSQLEYAVVIWNPFYNKYVDSLEKVQRKFLRSVQYRCYRNYPSYNDLLKNYNVMSLRSRRLYLETMFLYDMCNHRYDCSDITNRVHYIVPRTVIRREVRARPLFAVSSCRTNAGVRAPLRRISNNYNKLFTELDIFAMPANKFRNCLIESIKSL